MHPREGVMLRRPLGVDSGCFGFPGFIEAELHKVRCVGCAACESKEWKMEKKKRRTVLAVALVACLAFAGVMGVMAWYSSQSAITNTFTSGNIKPPTTDPTNPSNKDPLEPNKDPQDGGHKGQVDGNIVEDAWIPNSHITADSTVAKNPNVGIAPESDAAYVFVYVDNKLDKTGANTYFTLNSKWKPVAGMATEYGSGNNTYTGGLFMYVGDGSEAAMLQPDTVGKLDVWTGEIFSSVAANKDAQIADNPRMKVSTYLIAKSNDSEVVSATTAVDAAKNWANTELEKLA